jgi:hypothetical protein
MIRSLLFASCLLLTFSTQAQVLSNGAGGGNWNDPGTWIGGIVPDFNSGVITIQTGDQVNVDANFTIDQTTVQVGATLVVDPTATLSINNGVGTDFTMLGTLIVEGQFVLLNGATHTGTTAGNTSFVAGSIYRHQYTTSQGVILLATWDVESEIIIEGYTSAVTGTAGGNWNQNFGNFTWNCTSQTGIVNLAGFLTSMNSLTVLSTGTSIFRLSVNQNPAITITNDLTINGTSQVSFSTTGTNTSVSIGGNFNYTSTSGTSTLKTVGTCTLDIAGDFVMNAPGGTLSLSAGAGLGTLNIGGNFNLQAGTITESSSGNGVINFTGDVSHTFTNTGAVTFSIIYNIPVNNEVVVIGESIIQGGTGSAITVDGTLVVESVNATGAIITGTGAGGGNVRVTTRTFNAGSVLRYAGIGAQFMGNGQPANAGVTTIIDNAAGVSLNNSTGATVTIGGDLTLTNGDLTVELDNLVVDGAISLEGGDINFISTSAARTLTTNGVIGLSGGNISVTSGTANATFILNGDLTGNGSFSFTGVNSNLTIGGTNDLSIDFPIISPTTLESLILNRVSGSVVFPQSITLSTLLTIDAGNLIMNAPLTIEDGTVNAGSIVMNANLIVNDDLNMATGSTLFFEGQTVELRSQYNNTLSGGLFSSNSSSVLNILNTGVLGTISFDPAGNDLGTFILDRPTGGTLVTLNSVLNIENSFTLQNGDFLNTSGLTFASGATLTRNNLGAFSAGSVIPAGGPYNLIYTGAAGVTSGVEAAGNLDNLTSNSAATITLGSNVTVVNAITVNSGTLTCGANQVSSSTLTNLSTFNAPTAAGLLTLTGNLVNNGTFNRNGGTVVFDGNSSILGTSNPAFNNITIDGILTPPSTLNVHGAFTNNGTFNNSGSGTVAFLGTAGIPQVISGSTVTNFANITVSNTSADPDVTIGSDQNLLGVLTLNATVNFDADGSANTSVFTLLSSADNPTQDASIATLPGTANILGNVSVDRFMSIEGGNNSRIYRYISSPVQNPPVSQIQNFIPITGSFTGTSACSGCGVNQSMFLYTENVITDINGSGQNDVDDGYADFPATDNTETLAPGRGYTLFVRGNIAPVSTSGSAEWEVRAPINRGTINFNSFVSFTSSGNVANDGWNLVGNPFPSTIDWDAATGWTRTNVTNAIYMRDNGQTSPVYATYVGGVGTNGGSRFIPIGQAFFIKSNGGAINFQANENVKVAGTQGTFFREGAVDDMMRITLKRDSQKDEAVIRFSADATNGYDKNFDAFKLPNSIFNLSSISETNKYAINAIPYGTCNSAVQLNISNATPGSYQLLFTELQSFSSTPQVRVLDSFTGATTVIANDGVYAFTITSDPASSGNRFSVLIDQPQLNLNIQASAPQSLCRDNTYSINLTNTDIGVSYYAALNGIIISEKTLSAGGDLSLDVLVDKLSIGENSISIFAQRSGCVALPLNNGLSVSVDNVYEVQSVTDGVSCQAGTATLKASGASARGRYKWYATEDSVEPISETTEGLYVTPILEKSKTYYVSIVNSLGCEGPRVAVRAEVQIFESAQITETSYGVLTSNHSSGNVWFFNNELMQGEIGSFITVTQSGLYKLEVAIGSCKTTDEFEFIVTGVEEVGKNGISYHPNPVTDKLKIEITNPNVKYVQVISNTGLPLGTLMVNEERSVEIDFTLKPNGLYLIKLNDSRNTVSTFKIIKQ